MEAIKQMTCRSSKNTNSINEIIDNNISINNPAEIAEKFKIFFANIGPDLAKSIPTSKKQPTSYLKNEFPKSMFSYLLLIMKLVILLQI